MSLDRRAFLQTAGASAVSVNAHTNFEHSGTLTDVSGLRVGHFTSDRRPTGCTVVLFDSPAVAGVDVRGSAPGTRETDLLNPLNSVQAVNAIVLSGGSAFGLDAASGVVHFLDERHVGFPVSNGLVVPIVPAAIIYDLGVGDGKIRPDAESGYQACRAASNGPVPQGNVGAGAGATVGKLLVKGHPMKGGLGSASLRLGNTDLVMGAIVAVNAAGDIVDHRSGKLLAGARDENGKLHHTMSAILRGERLITSKGTNSTVGIVATNARMTKVEANKMAQMAHDGFARSINPVHSAIDGDTIFAAATATAKTEADITTLGSLAAECMALAIQNAIGKAESIPGYPAYRDLGS